MAWRLTEMAICRNEVGHKPVWTLLISRLRTCAIDGHLPTPAMLGKHC